VCARMDAILTVVEAANKILIQSNNG